MRQTDLGLSFGVGAMLLATHHAFADPARCGDHAAVMAGLAQGYGEARQAIALSGDNAVIEIFANAETGSWTITLTRPGGPTCMVAAGAAWQMLAEMLPPAGDPA